MDIVCKMAKAGISSSEVRSDVVETFMNEMSEMTKKKAISSSCPSWYESQSDYMI